MCKDFLFPPRFKMVSVFWVFLHFGCRARSIVHRNTSISITYEHNMFANFIRNLEYRLNIQCKACSSRGRPPTKPGGCGLT